MKNKKCLLDIVIVSIFVLALIVRLFYVINVTLFENQFDTGFYVEEIDTDTIEIEKDSDFVTEKDYDRIYNNYDKGKTECSQIHYIMLIYEKGQLPDRINGQFYHPPLHYFILAGWLKLVDLVTDINSIRLESMQLVTTTYSMITLFIFYKTLEVMKIDKKYRIIPMIFVAFFPMFIINAGLISNDPLVIMFEMLAMLYILKWQDDASYKNTIILSLALGFGLMTKSSMAVMFVPAVIIYFTKLNKSIDSLEMIKKLIIELVILTIIVSILGGWFHLSRLQKGLFTIGIIQPLEELSVTQYSIWERFGIPYIFGSHIENIWSQIMNTSVYCIYNSDAYGRVDILYLFEIVQIIIAFYLLYYILANAEKNRLVIITIIAWWISYIYLNISFPYSCSSNVRYIVVPIMLMLAFLGLGLQNAKKKTNKIIIYATTVISLIGSFYWLILL